MVVVMGGDSHCNEGRGRNQPVRWREGKRLFSCRISRHEVTAIPLEPPDPRW